VVLVETLRQSEQFRKCGKQGLICFVCLSAGVLLAVWSLSVKRGLVGQYYDNPDWRDAPIMTARDVSPTLQHMRRKFPTKPSNYSIEWTGVLSIPVSGSYQWTLGSDDGSWLWIDQQLAIDNGGYHAYVERSTTLTLEQGFHPVKIRYMQGIGFAYLNLFWTRPGHSQEPLPAALLFPQQPAAFRLAVDRVLTVVLGVFKWIWFCCLLAGLVIFVTGYRVILPVLKASPVGKTWHTLLTWFRKDEAGKPAFTWLPSQPGMFSIWLWAILALSLGLNLGSIWWGLPSFRGWAPDELTPAAILDGIEKGFSYGWFDRYPPLHYYLLTLVYTPMFILNRLHLVDIQSFSIYTILFYLGRLLSVLMGTATVFMAYLCGRELYARRASLFAALITALIAPFSYYAKIVNLDVPYIFWFVCSLYFYIRILKHHRLADYLLFATMTVFSICTKDQAYALYILMPIPIIISSARHLGSTGRFRALIAATINRKTMVSLVWAIILFLGIHNVLFNLSGFITHVKIITGPASEGYQVYENTLAGHIRMLWQSLKHIRFSFGWPLSLVCALGLGMELIRKQKNLLLLTLLIPGVSYYLFFISVILYNYDRFFIPICIMLAFFGGKCLADVLDLRSATQPLHLRKGSFALLLHLRKGSFALLLLISLILVYTFCYAVSLDILMAYDSRYYVESWLEQHAYKNAVIGLVGLGEYLPEVRKFPRKEYLSNPSLEAVKQMKPDYLIINADVRWGNKEFFTLLNAEKLEYTLVLQYRTNLKWLFLNRDDMVRNGRKIILTNFDKINPEIRVFKRVD
jgi:hypothetical protein